MAQAIHNAASPTLVDGAETMPEDTLRERIKDWVQGELIWYAGSFTLHLLGICSLLLLGNMAIQAGTDKTIEITAVTPERDPLPDVVRFNGSWDTTRDSMKPEKDKKKLEEIDKNEKEGLIDQQAIWFDNEKFSMAGGGSPVPVSAAPQGDPTGGNVFAPGAGPRLRAPGGLGHNWTSKVYIGPGGPGKDRSNHGHQDATTTGITHVTEKAVLAALQWLTRHQMPDGHWSLHQFSQCCNSGDVCTGPGSVQSDAAGTALGVLPFLAHGETPKVRTSPYRQTVERGLHWLVSHQKPDGDLSAGSAQQMYTHGLATIALCEAFEMTGDRRIGAAAQNAVNFIMAAQNQQTGGWRYRPGDAGDTSVLGWQVMALKSAQMAGLNVGGSSLEWAGKYLDSVAKGTYKAQFSYQPNSDATPAMTSVGLLCRQYLGAKRDDPAIVNGRLYLLEHQPDVGLRNVYYWYYATQVMYNHEDAQWDTWNRKMRKVLVDAQNHDPRACARGSWAPDQPVRDQWGAQGGRLMITSLSVLTLEVYYRLLPLYGNGHEDDLTPVDPGQVE